MSRRDIVEALTDERYGYSEWVRHRACIRKVAYATQIEARKIVLGYWRDDKDAHEYRCPYGDHWHVSTRPVEETSA